MSPLASYSRFKLPRNVIGQVAPGTSLSGNLRTRR
jgi:hypothetical protein